MTEDPRPTPAETAPQGSADIRQLTFYSLLSGLAPIIPVPFADDWTRDLVRKRLVAEIGRRKGFELPSGTVELLAVGEPGWSASGCFLSAAGGCVFKIVIYFVKKVFRKIIVVLLVKDCVDTFSETFHQSYLARHAMALGAIDRETPGARVVEVRRAIEKVVSETDHRPVERLARSSFRGSRKLLVRAARGLARTARSLTGRGKEERVYDEARFEDQEGELAGVVDELVAEISRQKGYLQDLEHRLEARLDRREAEKSP